MMDCHEAKERIRERRESAAVTRHLARCPDCAAFDRELRAGGRALAEAYLDTPPSAGFEDRVIARLREREIAVGHPSPRGRLLPILVPAAALLLLLGGYGLLQPFRPDPPPPRGKPVTTEPARLTPAVIRLARLTSDDETEVLLSFAGLTRHAAVTGDVEGMVLLAWAIGARRAEMVVSPGVPAADLYAVLRVLERTGFSYRLVRERDHSSFSPPR